MTRVIRWCAVVLALLLIPTVGFAASPWTEEATYQDKAAAKFIFGAKNLLLGWTEIFTQPKAAKDAGEGCPVAGLKGVWNAVGQTAGGAIHAATFLVPIDVPLPENGTQFLK